MRSTRSAINDTFHDHHHPLDYPTKRGIPKTPICLYLLIVYDPILFEDIKNLCNAKETSQSLYDVITLSTLCNCIMM